MISAKEDEREAEETGSLTETAAPSDIALLLLAVGVLLTALIKRRRRRQSGHR